MSDTNGFAFPVSLFEPSSPPAPLAFRRIFRRFSTFAHSLRHIHDCLPLLCVQPSAMSSYFARLSPVPSFPSYTGPYKVGSVDVELPVWELESPSPAPVDDISTVQYRVFYPCESGAKGRSVSWLPQPQRGYMSAYTRFLGTGSILADFIS